MDDSMDIRQTFAQRLRGLREAAGLTQKELADLLNYSRGSISYYENCDRVPDIVFLMAVSEFFSVGPHFLLGFSDNQSMSNEDLGTRFGLSDKAIEVLDSMELFQYQEFISAFIEHASFPKLFKCMELYSDGFSRDEISLHTALDEHEFRHFQISRIIMTILNDLQKDFIMCGRTVTALDNVDEEKRIQFYKDMLAQSAADSDRIMAKYEAERQADIERHNQVMAEKFKAWEEQEAKGRKARIAARDYVAAVDSSEGGGTNGND